jgi:hypothetical protein
MRELLIALYFPACFAMGAGGIALRRYGVEQPGRGLLWLAIIGMAAAFIDVLLLHVRTSKR